MSLPPDEHKEKWLDAITKHGAMVTFIAMELGINRKTVAKYRDELDWVKEAFAFVRETTLDEAELCIQRGARSNPKVAAWYLDRQGRARGYGKEIKVQSESAVKVNLYLPDNNRRTTDGS